MSWLIGICGGNFDAPEQYDDPNTISTNIMLELKKQGLGAEVRSLKEQMPSAAQSVLVAASICLRTRTRRDRGLRPLCPAPIRCHLPRSVLKVSQARIRTGSGEDVCQILNSLAQNALKAKNWKWNKPIYPHENFNDEVTPDEDVEVTTEKVRLLLRPPAL